MSKLVTQSAIYATSIVAFIFALVPEATFGTGVTFEKVSYEANVLLNRVFLCIIVCIVTFIICAGIAKFRRSINIKGNNYSIKVLYGNIFEMHDCLKVIPFDECYTTKVGNASHEINDNSICGQYLKEYPIDDIQSLISEANLKPLKSKSKYKRQERYESGSIIPRDDYLLLAFTKLDDAGLGRMTCDELLECLFLMWKEINKHHNGKSVCVPILGSGVTRIDDKSLTQQELLDIIIGSYKMSPHKVETPKQLYIVCKENENFALKNVGNYI